MSAWLLSGIGWLVGWFGIFGVRRLFPHLGWLRKNYLGQMIPAGYGIVFPVAYALYIAVAKEYISDIEKILIGLSVIVALVGWLDDRIGTQTVKGLRGHFGRLLREGKITTGVMKAGVISVCASVAALSEGAGRFGFEWIIDSMVIALVTNFVNLLDVRPGRALKGFWLLQGLCFLFGNIPALLAALFLYMLTVTVAAAPADLSARVMLGDTGANVLGFFAGVFCAVSFLLSVKLLLVGVLIWLHLYAERVSLTEIIECNRWLRRIDEWGR
jgi:UDP-GlcNAc:undecaprenyl-phosphate GlcNAc-1-phosphate transferase